MNQAGWSIFSWNFKFTTGTIGILITENVIPIYYKLYTNFPNPFNPQTKIKFDIPKASTVKIVVYDVMGREVQTLVNESLKPGTYEASFDGSQLTSGVYFYKISAGDFSETKKMLIVKLQKSFYQPAPTCSVCSLSECFLSEIYMKQKKNFDYRIRIFKE